MINCSRIFKKELINFLRPGIFLTGIVWSHFIFAGVGGQDLFVRHCLNCHVQNGLGGNFIFSSLQRIAAAKDGLIESLKSKEMPPLQFSVGKPYLPISGGIEHLDDKSRQKIITWLQSIDGSKNLHFQERHFRTTLFQTNSAIAKANYDVAWTITNKDLEFRTLRKAAFDSTTTFKIKLPRFLEKQQPASFVGYKVEANAFVHHFEMRYLSKDSGEPLFLWTPSQPKTYLIPYGFRIEQKDLRNLYFIKHNYYGENFSLLKDDDKITIYFSNRKPNIQILKLIYDTPGLVTFVPLDGLTREYTATTDFILETVFPHMHKGGQELSLKLFRPLYAQPIQIANFYGWVEDIQVRYRLEQKLHVRIGDKLVLNCQIDASKKVISVGWVRNSEMCLSTLYVSGASKLLGGD